MHFPLFIKTTPFVCDIFYIITRRMDKLQRIIHRLNSTPKHKLLINGNYKTNLFVLSITNLCNARCNFCIYPKVPLVRGFMSEDIFRMGLKKWKEDGGLTVDLTPMVGDVLLDKNLISKLNIVHEMGMTSKFTTNLIAADTDTIDNIFKSNAITNIYISLASLDQTIYKKVYGVDRLEQVYQNLIYLLRKNKELGHPIKIGIWFRNEEMPWRILTHKKFPLIKSFLNKRVTISFTLWFDNWGGGIQPSDINGFMKLRDKDDTYLPCIGLTNLNVRWDGQVRLCGCRFLKSDVDDLTVGHISEDIKTIKARAIPIINGFYSGIRPETCKNCSFYKPA